MKDKRNFPRKLLETNAVLKDDTMKISVVIRDITVKGMLLETDKQVVVGETMQLDFEAHEDMNPTQLDGKIVRCDAVTDGGGKYLVGLSLLNPDDTYMMDALAYIHKY